VILRIAWSATKQVTVRALDGIDPDVLSQIEQATLEVPGVEHVSEVRARWLGHQIHSDVNIAVSDNLSVKQGHAIAKRVHHHLIQNIDFLGGLVIHVDPLSDMGEARHYNNGT
jgi:divalent metal cation (Fe/Co/Zn/Cd) transporter